MDIVFDKAKEKMDSVIQALKKDLNSVSTGRANPNLLDAVRVDSYGSFVPINQIANITVPDSSTISIQPWDKSMVSHIDKAIVNANLGFTPKVEGMIIRINIPKLTEERRKELSKLVKKYGEDKKVSIRNNRRDAIDDIKKRKTEFSEDNVKKFNDRIQKLTDEYIEKIDTMVTSKEKEIMTI